MGCLLAWARLLLAGTLDESCLMYALTMLFRASYGRNEVHAMLSSCGMSTDAS